MVDYKKMYLTLFNASEEAVKILIAAQRECEELYISDQGLLSPKDMHEAWCEFNPTQTGGLD